MYFEGCMHVKFNKSGYFILLSCSKTINGCTDLYPGTIEKKEIERIVGMRMTYIIPH